MEQNERMSEAKLRFVLSIFTLGLINNYGYVVVMVGADALSKYFHVGELMPLFLM